MGSLSIFHIITLLIVLGVIFGLVIYPISNILRRAGWSGWLALLWLVPLLNLILLWTFAFGAWPNLPEKST